MSAKPIDFVYDFDSESYDMSEVSSDADLVNLIQLGDQ